MDRKRALLRQQAEEQPPTTGVEATFRRQPTREPVSRVQLIMPARLHRALKLKAAQDGTTVTQLILHAIEQTYHLPS
jgi:predicted HicB family RNase H-like nuclease